jgi:hypothetical protein
VLADTGGADFDNSFKFGVAIFGRGGSVTAPGFCLFTKADGVADF